MQVDPAGVFYIYKRFSTLDTSMDILLALRFILAVLTVSLLNDTWQAVRRGGGIYRSVYLGTVPNMLVKSTYNIIPRHP